MDLFPEGALVRLRSRGRENKYVYALEDAVGVTLRPLGPVPTLNEVWKADLWPAEDGDALLLQSAAYGKYLAVAHKGRAEAAPRGYRGVHAMQRSYNFVELNDSFAWRPVRVDAGQNCVRLHSIEHRCLRANGRHRRWKNRVTVDVRNGDDTTMMQWVVEAIPSTPDPLPLPPPFEPPIHPRRGLFRRRAGHDLHQHHWRRIRYVRLDDEGNYADNVDECGEWPVFIFYGNSVYNLRTEVARLLHDENITLGVRAGFNGLVIPLVTNLPDSEDLMEIVVYTTGSPAAAELRYPEF